MLDLLLGRPLAKPLYDSRIFWIEAKEIDIDRSRLAGH